MVARFDQELAEILRVKEKASISKSWRFFRVQVYFMIDAGEQSEDFQTLDVEVSLSCISSPLSVVLGSSSDSLTTSSWLSVNSSIACDVPDEDYD